MPIIQPPPNDIKDTDIYKRMHLVANPDDGVASKCAEFLDIVTPLLDLIAAGPFRDFTLHNRDHARKVLHLMGVIAGKHTIDQLSKLECQFLIYSACLHDLGLMLTTVERERLIKTQEFVDYLNNTSKFSILLKRTRDQASKLLQDGSEESDPEKEAELLKIEELVFQIHDAALSDYLRPKHANIDTYRKLISTISENSGNNLFEYKGISFLEEIILICWSHNEDAAVLAGIKNAYDDVFPRDHTICGEKINLQYCGALLRIADVIDFDRERTPRSLFTALGISNKSIPGSEVSLREWNKHLAVHTIDLHEEEIIIIAQVRHPVIESGIREFCSTIEREIRDTTSVLKRNPKDITEKYLISIPLSVRPRIQPQGYIFKDMAFRLDQNSVMNLLMGENLYSNPSTPIREMLQNSTDACMVRMHLAPDGYSPRISISDSKDENDRYYISVKDNGIGMDEHVLFNYFFNVGSSYYGSYEFKRLMSQTASGSSDVPISRFGIGMVSVFMIADSLEVRTQNKYSIRHDTKNRNLTIDAKGGLAFVTESSDDEQGTEVRLFIKENYNSDGFRTTLVHYLQKVIARPKVPISVKLGNTDCDLKPAKRIKLSSSAAEYLSGLGVQAVMIDVGRWSDGLSGTVVLFFGKHPDGKLRNTLPNGQKMRIRFNLHLDQCLTNYSGNRITVNGMTMSLRKANRFLGRDLACVIDIDVTGDSRVEYNVSREKLTGSGIAFVRNELRKSVLMALEDMELLDRVRINNQAFGLIQEQIKDKTTVEVIDNVLACKIKSALPTHPWPKGIHRTIAEQFAISNNKASKIITFLISSGQVQAGLADSPLQSPNK